ncbi:MAG: MlaD family protein [Thermovirgaceae bacterium]|nr:MlaD family protein [Synergistales bacterium]HPC76065.1 MlaD family protein [Synergistales bacterium]HRS48741.1 MlaD family protein [Thermovirgaceae bacterium]HRU90946.1 MlaD family protein [Thermovirgaceae bacterium]
MNREMRVGLVVFLAIVFLGSLVFVSGGARFRQHGYSFGIVFPDAMGLDTGAPVLVSGVESGKVVGIELLKEGVLVRVNVRSHVIVPLDSRFIIDTGGLLGEPRVKVTRGDSLENITEGDAVSGTIPPSLDEIMTDIKTSLGGLQSTFSNINTFLAKLSEAAGEFQEFSREARDQVKRAGDSLTGLTENIDSLVQENRGALMASLENLSQFLGNLKKVVDQFDEGGTSGQDLRQMIVRIKGAAESLEALSRKIEVALFDDTAPAPSRIQEVKEMVGKANRIISDIEDLSFEGKVGLYRGVSGSSESDIMGDVSLWVKSRSRKMGFLIGADDIGGDPKVTAGLGLHGDRWGFWGGAVRGYPGAGFLLHPVGSQGPLSVIAQWWNENGGSWSLEGRYRFNDSWGLFYRYLEKGDDSVGSVGFFYLF